MPSLGGPIMPSSSARTLIVSNKHRGGVLDSSPNGNSLLP